MTRRPGLFDNADIVGIEWDTSAVPTGQLTDVDALRRMADQWEKSLAGAGGARIIRAAADDLLKLRAEALAQQKTITTLGRMLKARDIDPGAALTGLETVAQEDAA